MTEERIEVLKLVADKVIEVDQAERLLRALDEGDRARSEARRPNRVDPDPRRSGGVAGAFGGMGEVLGALGEMVESTVVDALRWTDDDVGEALPLGEFVIPPGGRLSIRQHGHSWTGTTVLTLLPADGDQCTIEAIDSAADVRIRREVGIDQIRWRAGRLTVRIPATVEHVDARVMGGDLLAFDLGCPIDARTMGGRMELGTRMPFEVRTAGGELLLRLAPGLHGSSRVSSMGGPVVIVPSDGVGARIEAACTGGEVRVDPGLGRVRQDGNRLHRKSVIDVGPENGQLAEIVVKTMGGDVVLTRAMV